jgi:hypothetical protein
MGSIVSCATRNEVKQPTNKQRRMQAAYAKYFAALEQELERAEDASGLSAMIRLEEELAALEQELEGAERMAELTALDQEMAEDGLESSASRLGNGGVPPGCNRWMAFKGAHSELLSRLVFSNLAESSKALYSAKVNDLIRISRPVIDDHELSDDDEEHTQSIVDQTNQRTPPYVVHWHRLPLRTSAGGPDEDENECAVCLSRFEQGDLVRMLPCRHEFHEDCVDKWLLEQDRRCPCCRIDVCTSLLTWDSSQRPSLPDSPFESPLSMRSYPSQSASFELPRRGTSMAHW